VKSIACIPNDLSPNTKHLSPNFTDTTIHTNKSQYNYRTSTTTKISNKSSYNSHFNSIKPNLEHQIHFETTKSLKSVTKHEKLSVCSYELYEVEIQRMNAYRMSWFWFWRCKSEICEGFDGEIFGEENWKTNTEWEIRKWWMTVCIYMDKEGGGGHVRRTGCGKMVW